MRKKGFIQVVEVVIAAIFIAIAISIFFNINTKLNWERSDLIDAGNSILSAIYYSGNFKEIFNNSKVVLGGIDYMMPANMKYALRIDGSPKPLIRVACICTDSQVSYAKQILTPVYFNDYWIKFNVDKVDFTYANITDYDLLLFINYTAFASNEANIKNYLSTGKGIISINASYNDPVFFELFNLTTSTNPVANVLYFRTYKPWENKIEKYFMGFGFNIDTPTKLIDGKYQGTWKIWGWSKEVNTTGTTVEIEGVGSLPENGRFTLTQPINGLDYEFKVKKIWSDKSGVIIQTTNTTFPFNNFIEAGEEKVSGNNIVGNDPAALTVNNSAIWISDFPEGDEYATLLKAAISSIADNFYALSPINIKENVEVTKFFSMCCDTPETVKATLILWYVL